jgi:hypothetical protein
MGDCADNCSPASALSTGQNHFSQSLGQAYVPTSTSFAGATPSNWFAPSYPPSPQIFAINAGSVWPCCQHGVVHSSKLGPFGLHSALDLDGGALIENFGVLATWNAGGSAKGQMCTYFSQHDNQGVIIWASALQADGAPALDALVVSIGTIGNLIVWENTTGTPPSYQAPTISLNVWYYMCVKVDGTTVTVLGPTSPSANVETGHTFSVAGHAISCSSRNASTDKWQSQYDANPSNTTCAWDFAAGDVSLYGREESNQTAVTIENYVPATLGSSGTVGGGPVGPQDCQGSYTWNTFFSVCTLQLGHLALSDCDTPYPDAWSITAIDQDWGKALCMAGNFVKSLVNYGIDGVNGALAIVWPPQGLWTPLTSAFGDFSTRAPFSWSGAMKDAVMSATATGASAPTLTIAHLSINTSTIAAGMAWLDPYRTLLVALIYLEVALVLFEIAHRAVGSD